MAGMQVSRQVNDCTSPSNSAAHMPFPAQSSLSRHGPPSSLPSEPGLGQPVEPVASQPPGGVSTSMKSSSMPESEKQPSIVSDARNASAGPRERSTDMTTSIPGAQGASRAGACPEGSFRHTHE